MDEAWCVGLVQPRRSLHGHRVDRVRALDAGVSREEVGGALVEDEADEENERAVTHEPRGESALGACSCTTIGHESSSADLVILGLRQTRR